MSEQSEDEPQERDRQRAGMILDAALQGVLTALEVAKPEFASVVAMLGVPAKAALMKLAWAHQR